MLSLYFTSAHWDHLCTNKNNNDFEDDDNYVGHANMTSFIIIVFEQVFKKSLLPFIHLIK